MITTIHILSGFIHGAVMHGALLGVSHLSLVVHIAGHSLYGLCCEQYENGQQDVFHRDIIHNQLIGGYGKREPGKFPVVTKRGVPGQGEPPPGSILVRLVRFGSNHRAGVNFVQCR